MLTTDRASGPIAYPVLEDVREISVSYMVVDGSHRRATEWRRAHKQAGCPQHVFYVFTDTARGSTPTMAVRCECGAALEGELLVDRALSDDDKRNTPYWLDPFEQNHAEIWRRMHSRECDVRLFTFDFCLHVRPGEQVLKRMGCGCGRSFMLAGREPEP